MDTNKKIAIVFTKYNPPYFTGGIERYIYNLNCFLRNKGHEVKVIVMKDNNNYNDELNNIYKIGVPRIPILSTLVFCYKLNKQIKNFDIINIHYPTFGLFLKKNKRIIYTIHTLASEEIKYRIVKNKILKKLKLLEKTILEFISFKKASKFICLNNSLRLQLKSKYNIPDHRIKIIANGIEIKKFDQKKYQNSKTEVINFLYLGRITQRKNLSILVEAFSLIKHTNINLSIAGIGEYEEDLKEKVNKLNLQSKVNFLGYKEGDDLLKCYAESDVYVLPSFYEGMPFTVLEAMASRKPVLLGKFDSSEKLAIKDYTGYVVKENSPEEFAVGIRYFIDKKNDLKQLGENAFNHVESKYSLKPILKQYLAELL